MSHERVNITCNRTDGKCQKVVVKYLESKVEGHNHHYTRTIYTRDTQSEPVEDIEKDFFFTAPLGCTDDRLLECAQKRAELFNKFMTL